MTKDFKHNQPLDAKPPLQASPDGQVAPAAPAASASPAHDEHFKTPGEKIHKWSVYLGVDWVYNAVTGIAFVYWGKYTESGKKYWSGPIIQNLEKAFKPMIKDPESLAKSVDHGNTFISIIAGGMLTIPPLIILEKNNVRKWFAKKYDTMIYGKEKVENDPEFQAAYKRMDEEPKKDFNTGMIARFAALAPLLASVTIPTARKEVERFYFGPLGKMHEASVLGLGIHPEKVIQKISPHIDMHTATERWRYINDKAVPMELGFDIPYAVMHKFWYDQFARFKGVKDDSGVEKKPQATEVHVAANTPAPEVSDVTVQQSTSKKHSHEAGHASTAA